jgi:N-methylhydantoinase B
VELGNIGLDPITTEVISNSLASVVEEMRAALIRSAYSTNIKERQDCSTGLMDETGRVIVNEDAGHPLAVGSFIFTGAAILDRFPKLGEGDLFVLNDPYSGGPSHLADVTFVGPVFHQGAFIGFVGNTGHWPDVGGKAPGQSAFGDATEIYQEGLRIPPIRLYRAGELQEEILELVLLNVRDREDRAGDIRAHIGSLRLGIRRMEELAARYGGSIFSEALREMQRLTEVKVRHGILQLREGDYEAAYHLDADMDAEEPILLRVQLRVRHTPEPSITVDFTGTNGAARSGINCIFPVTAAGVYWALRSILDPSMQPNDGFWAPIKVIAPEGCLLNARPPSPVGARSEVALLIPDLLFAALAPIVDGNIEAGSHGVHGMGFSSQRPPNSIYYETLAGGGGARPSKDGIDGVHGASNLPVEAMEMEFPIMADRLEYVPDSGGAGRFRGGLGVRKDYRLMTDAFIATHSNRHEFPGPGLLGGKDGALTRIVRNPDSDSSVVLSRQATFIPVDAGDVAAIISGGGGGYGNPLERDPAAVLSDVIDGKVTYEKAHSDYGVVIDRAKWVVDEKATARRRHRLGRGRLVQRP